MRPGVRRLEDVLDIDELLCMVVDGDVQRAAALCRVSRGVREQVRMASLQLDLHDTTDHCALARWRSPTWRSRRIVITTALLSHAPQQLRSELARSTMCLQHLCLYRLHHCLGALDPLYGTTLPVLDRLDLDECTLSPSFFVERALARPFPALRSLRLARCVVAPGARAGLHHAFGVLAMPHLKDVTVQLLGDIDAGVEDALHILCQRPLEVLRVCYSIDLQRAMRAGTLRAARFGALRALSVDERLGNEALDIVSSIARAELCTGLRDLRVITSVPSSNASARNFANALHRFALHCLDLVFASDRSAILALLDALGAHSSLQTCRLSVPMTISLLARLVDTSRLSRTLRVVLLSGPSGRVIPDDAECIVDGSIVQIHRARPTFFH